jgi:hypothetical protein
MGKHPACDTDRRRGRPRRDAAPGHRRHDPCIGNPARRVSTPALTLRAVQQRHGTRHCRNGSSRLDLTQNRSGAEGIPKPAPMITHSYANCQVNSARAASWGLLREAPGSGSPDLSSPRAKHLRLLPGRFSKNATSNVTVVTPVSCGFYGECGEFRPREPKDVDADNRVALRCEASEASSFRCDAKGAARGKASGIDLARSSSRTAPVDSSPRLPSPRVYRGGQRRTLLWR